MRLALPAGLNRLQMVSILKPACFENEDGAMIWCKDLLSDFDGKNILWGMNETPVVDGEVIYATPGGKENNVVALNRFSGDLIWNCSVSG